MSKSYKKKTRFAMQIVEEIVRTCWHLQHPHLYTVSPACCVMSLQAPVDSDADNSDYALKCLHL